jgi:hypothetical protein
MKCTNATKSHRKSGVAEWRDLLFPSIHSRAAFHGSVALPFVIPERTRISCHAVLDKAACAPFRREGRMKCTNATKFQQEIRGSVVEGSAVQQAFPGNVFRAMLASVQAIQS